MLQVNRILMEAAYRNVKHIFVFSDLWRVGGYCDALRLFLFLVTENQHSRDSLHSIALEVTVTCSVLCFLILED